ncbi:MAG: response regulator transcription factor [Kiritimatiellae bacterium]|nr:response regulator transcription factor [Kiritimatiellia bacterium]MDD5520574.1 response regulator transcription factor [Kiritimatiellia bacterium]
MKSKRSIILVDNHDGMRGIMSNWLGINFPYCTILEAGTGEDCMTLVKTKRPVIVLTDLYLPGIDGIETTRRIKEHDPDIHVVILTLYDDPLHRDAAKNAGARDYVLKYQINKCLIPILKELLPPVIEEKDQKK